MKSPNIDLHVYVGCGFLVLTGYFVGSFHLILVFDKTVPNTLNNATYFSKLISELVLLIKDTEVNSLS